MSRVSIWLLVPAVAVLLGFFVLPIVFVAAVSLQSGSDIEWGLQRYTDFLSSSFHRDVLLRTLGISLAVVLCTLLLGYPVAYWLVRTRNRFRMFFRALVFFHDKTLLAKFSYS